MRHLLLLLTLACPLLAGCKTPGSITVMLPTSDGRVDVAVADVFRVPIDERRRMIKNLVVQTRGLRRATSPDEGQVLLQDVDYNAWVSEFERELVRRDVHVIDRDKLEQLIRERSMAEGEAARLLGADALFQVSVLEMRTARRPEDLRAHRLVREVGERVEPVDELWLEDVVCRVDAKLILGSGVVLWSGEVTVPASSLVQSGSYQAFYRIADVTRDGTQVLARATASSPNPVVSLTWDPFLEDVTSIPSLPSGITSTSRELVLTVIKVAARRCVAEIFHADMPGGEAPQDGG
jgi:hypothetical protein